MLSTFSQYQMTKTSLRMPLKVSNTRIQELDQCYKAGIKLA